MRETRIVTVKSNEISKEEIIKIVEKYKQWKNKMSESYSAADAKRDSEQVNLKRKEDSAQDADRVFNEILDNIKDQASKGCISYNVYPEDGNTDVFRFHKWEILDKLKKLGYIVTYTNFLNIKWG